MVAAHLFLGQGGGNNLCEMAVGTFDDAGMAYDILGSSVPIAPAGIGGEAIFYACWIAVTYSMDVILRFRFFVDDVEIDAQDVFLDQGDEQTVVLEFALSVAILGATGLVAVKQAARGSVFRVQVETDSGIGDGVLIIEGRELEAETVRESRAAETG